MAGTVLLLALTFRPVVEGDGVGYYSFLHAAFVSHRLDYTSEYGAAIASHTPLYLPSVTDRTSAGTLTDLFPAGSAVLSAPAYLIALAFRPAGEPQYGSPFVDAFTLASLFYGLMALAISYRLAAAVVANRRPALVAVLGAFFATPMVYYTLSDPSYSHTFSAFCASAFLYTWWTGPPKRYRGWFALGVLGGLMAMTRYQDGLLMAIVLVDARRLNWRTLALIPGAIVGFAPQLVIDQLQLGQWLPRPFPDQTINPLSGHFLEVLFSTRYGLFVLAPAAILAVVGGFFIRDRRLKLACGLAFLLEIAVIGSASDTAGSAIGPRRFLCLLPFAVVALVALIARLRPWIGYVALATLSAWNLVLMANLEYVTAGNDPGSAGLTVGQLAAVQYVPRLFAKGAVVRDLVLWRQAHTGFDLVGGLTLLALEAACVLGMLALVARLRPVERQGNSA